MTCLGKMKNKKIEELIHVHSICANYSAKIMQNTFANNIISVTLATLRQSVRQALKLGYLMTTSNVIQAYERGS